MASFSDTPLEVIAEIIEALQDDVTTLKSCSQTCRSLLPLCRKSIFRTIELEAKRKSLPRSIISFGSVLDSNPSISDYVQNLVYQIQPQDFDDDDVPPILTKLHRVQSFRLIGENADWTTLRQPFRESLSHIIYLHSITSLEISYFRVFPIVIFLRCLNLTNLTLIHIDNDATDRYKQKNSISDVVPQLQSFTFGVAVCKYVGRLLGAKRSNGLPVLDFHNLRTLSVNVEEISDLPVVHALLKATKKLETLEYIADNLPDGYKGLAASMNSSSLLTLRKIRFEFDISDDIQDPLCGISDELRALSGVNRIEEINLKILVDTDSRCSTDEQWGTLDAALATGFPMLRRVSLHINIAAFWSLPDTIAFQAKLDKLPEEHFPWLSTGSTVQFNFSTQVEFV